jgi:hypothetical protein
VKRLAILLGVLLMSWSNFSPAMAQESRDNAKTESTHLKKPLIAFGLGLIVPGGGHFYANEIRTGITLFGIGAAGAATSAIAWKYAEQQGGVDTFVDATLYSTAGIIVYFGAYLYSVIDAPKAAHRANKKLRSSRIRVEPSLITINATQQTYGLTLKIQL